MKLIENIQQLRKLQKITGAKLCKDSGLSVTTIWNILHGHHSPTVKTVNRLAKALNVSSEDLMFGGPFEVSITVEIINAGTNERA